MAFFDTGSGDAVLLLKDRLVNGARYQGLLCMSAAIVIFGCSHDR